MAPLCRVLSTVMSALGWTLTAVIALGALAGCDRVSSADPAPTPTASTTAAPLPEPPSTAGRADGLSIRYLDRDGTVQTLEPKDFPR
jgi:hypothetical protein